MKADGEDVTKNAQKLIKLCHSVMERIYRSVDDCPP